MEHLKFNYMKKLIAAKIFSETQRLNDLAASGEQPKAKDVTEILLNDLRGILEEYGDEFLPDELLNKVLEAASGEQPKAENVTKISLDDLRGVFEGYGDEFLLDELLHKVLEVASSKQSKAEDVPKILLDDLRGAFEEYGDEFLSDKLLNKVLEEVERTFDSFRAAYSKGTRIVLAALPCNINGTLFDEEDIKSGEYLTAFTVNKLTGLSMGFGALTPSTYAQMLPEEIFNSCSVIVDYKSDTNDTDDVDFENFKKQYTKAYKELRKLLKQ